ncbi:MAG: (2Fe-2S)-binding protein [Firmicutes bacterium]|nr:(2Fe-2S)-binding protein [Bacillota bacterium]
MRIKHHPILGEITEKKIVVIYVDGKKIEAIEGEPIAAALLAAGIRIFRKTIKTAEPRGLYCGIGQCNDCIMEVNGVSNVRTCVTLVEDGMVVKTQVGKGKGGDLDDKY